jgi:hypothetical protein
MSLDNLKSQIDIIKVLGNPKYRKAILAHADKRLITSLCELIYNVLKNNINISEQNRAKLLKHRKFLRELCEKSSLKAKKKILIQKGGFLQFLIPAVIGGIAQIISSAISRPADPPAQ